MISTYNTAADPGVVPWVPGHQLTQILAINTEWVMGGGGLSYVHSFGQK